MQLADKVKINLNTPYAAGAFYHAKPTRYLFQHVNMKQIVTPNNLSNMNGAQIPPKYNVGICVGQAKRR